MTPEEILPIGKNSFSHKEVASYLEHDASTVNRWCQNGMEGAFKPQGRWRIARSAVASLLVAFGVATTTSSLISANSSVSASSQLTKSEIAESSATQCVKRRR